MKSILVPLLGLGGDHAPLELASRIAMSFSSHLDALHVRRDTVEELSEITMGEAVVTQALYDIIAEDNKTRCTAAKAAFDALCAGKKIEIVSERTCPTSPSASWHQIIGRPREQIALAGRRHELVVLGTDAEPFCYRTSDLGVLVFELGRPVLLAPKSLPGHTGQTIAIAWKNTPEAARAISAAGPLIARARKLIVISVGENGYASKDAEAEAQQLATQLQWAAPGAEIRCSTAGCGSASESILEGARGCGADLLIMGAYGHSRAREFVFGGVTRDFLKLCPLPVLLAH